MRGSASFPIRLRYDRRGKIRWISHRDTARAFERAFRVESLPLAFSEGFSPRPRVSFGPALPTGAESDAEYLDVDLAAEVDLDALPGRLSEALPDGMSVTGAAALAERAPALMDAVTLTVWRVEVERLDGGPIDPGDATAWCDAALAAPVLLTARRRRGQEVDDDVRPLLRRLAVAGLEPGVWLDLELDTHPRSAKPAEVVAAVAACCGMPGGLLERRAVRIHQFIERDGARLEPLSADTLTRAEARAS